MSCGSLTSLYMTQPPAHALPLVSQDLQALPLQDQPDLLGVQRLVHQQSVRQVLVLLSVRLEQGPGSLVRVLHTHTRTHTQKDCFRVAW